MLDAKSRNQFGKNPNTNWYTEEWSCFLQHVFLKNIADRYWDLGYISLFRNKARFMQYLMNVFPRNAKKMSMLIKIRIQGIHYVVQNEKKTKIVLVPKIWHMLLLLLFLSEVYYYVEQPIWICFWFYYIILDFIILFKRKIKSIVLLPFISSRKVLEYTYSLLFQCHDMQ